LKKYRVSTQNPQELAFSFIEKLLYAMKMTQKSIFYAREAHILSRLDFKKNLSFDSTKGWVAFGFTEKHLSVTKTSQKYVFHPCDTHILS
jgi:hypothetical protein